MYSWHDIGMKRIKGPVSKYMTPEETALLISLVSSVSPKVMIEFGCNTGLTARCILDSVKSLEKYIGIDVSITHKPELVCQMSEVPMLPGGLVDDVRFALLLEDSRLLTKKDLEPCDAVFIDGDHSERAVLYDSYLARELVRPGGIICWHDFSNPAVEVTQAISKLYGEGWPIACVEHSWLAFMRVGD